MATYVLTTLYAMCFGAIGAWPLAIFLGILHVTVRGHQAHMRGLWQLTLWYWARRYRYSSFTNLLYTVTSAHICVGWYMYLISTSPTSK